jgi:hypothetical protein
MQLGDVIAGLADEVFANETMLAMGDLALAARIADAAAAEGVSRGEFVASAVGRFTAGCSEEEWLTVLGQMRRVADPGEILLRRAVTAALDRADTPSACGGHDNGGCRCGGQHG